MVKWEYKIEWGNISSDKLNKLGDDGWELVAVERNEATALKKYFFKRIKQ
jgi:hypothetical protein